MQWGESVNYWSEPHHCISLHRRSWGIQMRLRQSHSSSSPHSVVVCLHLAWCSPQYSGSCDLKSKSIMLIFLLCKSSDDIYSTTIIKKHAPLYSTMMQVSISGCTPSIKIMNLRCWSICWRSRDSVWLMTYLQ